MTARPKNGPRLAPAMSEMADMITQGIAVPGSTQALWASFMGLGTFSGTFQILRRNETMSPPRAVNGIHHHLPAHQPVPVSPKKKPMPAPVIPMKRRANRPPAPPSTSANRSSRLYHGFSRGSMTVTYQFAVVLEYCNQRQLSCVPRVGDSLAARLWRRSQGRRTGLENYAWVGAATAGAVAPWLLLLRMKTLTTSSTSSRAMAKPIQISQ